MDAELREAIGRALYNASFDFDLGDMPTWDELLEKEEWMARAEKVVSAFLAHMRDNYGKEE
ncbi:MAG: hypothetical protein AUF65_01330 [Chloroflexi bacterium 13_1_20CM_50_12]|nr:MAG: hypothetical protein AUF65_01330 [Chloroflexi bacterium 13_1_20CM_50_12]